MWARSQVQRSAPPIRVLHVVDNLDVGGVREVLLDLLSRHSDERLKLGVLTLSGDLAQAERLLPPHVTPLSAPYRRAYPYGILSYLSDGVLMQSARRHGRDVLQEIESFAPDILHFHTHPRDLGLGVIAQRLRPMALVFTDSLVRIRPGDYSAPSRFLLRFSYRRLYRHFHVISCGPVVAQCNSDAGFLHPSKHHLLIENTVDLETFKPPPEVLRVSPIQIIFVGRIHPVKGVDTLVRAFAMLRPTESVELLLVGPDATDGALQQFAASNVRAPLHVRFLGEIPRAAVPSLLQRASIGVLPSRREGLPLALLEQMACGLPVVVSDIPELTDVVTHGESGMIVPLDDVGRLADTLHVLLGDPQLRASLGKAARALVERRASTATTDELIRLYERLAPADDYAA